MSRTFNEYLAIIDVLMTNLQASLEEALQRADVPLHLQDQVREYLRGPVSIEPPTLLVEKTALRLCEPLSDQEPQHYWNAFRAYLEAERRWQRNAIGRLAETSQTLVCRLPRPREDSTYQLRGLVVGYIQSGKTATMASLIARAADQGYRFFIVLAGLYKDLRAQTQRRLDQEITGLSDNPADGPFVLHDPGADRWVRLTHSGLEGDFDPGTLQMDVNPQTPKLLVIKKIPRVIERLTTWLGTSPLPLQQLPALVIDDEADQASIDTNYGRQDEAGDPIDPSRTNACIRDLLQLLPKCAYVGFTATPFANVLIDANLQDDLYPRHFIASLPEPDDYFGPRELFGLGMTPSDLASDPPELPALDVIRTISDDQLTALDQLSAGGDCPEVLSTALLTWLLSCCARMERGQDRVDFSMLVHPSQSTWDHHRFAEALRREIAFLQRATASSSRNFPDLLFRAKELWESDFIPVTRVAAPDQPIRDFESVWRFSRTVAESIEICVLNYGSDDSLQYSNPPPKRYAVVGGNRLSRGLTLEGLSVSLFTRTASTYDTLLQMGRWFGYRPGYHDLTRIFVEPRLAALFADLARVELELRSDLRKYAQEPDPPTPAELAPKIRVHPAMAVTSRMKMGAARAIRVSFENTTQNTVNFPTGNRRALEENLDAARSLVRRLGRPPVSESPEGMHIWRDVPAENILGFLRAYTFGAGATAVNRETLMDYITRLNERGELRLWDLCIPRGNPDLEPVQWAPGIASRTIRRTPTSVTSIRTLQSPPDQRRWRELSGRDGLDPDLACLMFYVIDHKESGVPEAPFRPTGVNILGLVLLFPRSSSGVTVPYLSQHVQ
jgi:Z1 domain